MGRRHGRQHTASRSVSLELGSTRLSFPILLQCQSHSLSTALLPRVAVTGMRHCSNSGGGSSSSSSCAPPTTASSASTTSKQHLHSSASVSQSTTTMHFAAPHVEHPSAAAAAAAAAVASDGASSSRLFPSQSAADVPAPSWNALRTLFVASAIPMVGFGFMDNLVMIQAGQYIDSTLGVSLGLATMSAAAAGQVVSDVSGVVFGGTLERFLTRLSLIEAPALTPAQRQLSICRNVSMAGAVLGVIFGCALGATTLLLVDLEARDRMDRATQLREIVTDMMSDDDKGDKGDGSKDAAAAATSTKSSQKESSSSSSSTEPVSVVHGGLAAETATVYFTSGKDFHLDAPEREDDERRNHPLRRTRLLLLPQEVAEADDDTNRDSSSLSSSLSPSTALLHACATKRRVLLDPTGQVLVAPIVVGDDLVAVMEFCHQRPSEVDATNSNKNGHAKSDSGGFGANDVLTAQIIARHVAIFINRIRN